ncbi:MAG: N-acetylmuramoyl-L-alanine amidase [Burkholderiales bacterium]|nr:N-acetylmuramoyl-L-alanine amidase [Burkholderiales bacterium]
MKKILLLAFFAAILSGCATTRIDTSISAVSQESRVQFLILHYTALDQPTSLKVLSQQGVSANYLVGNDDPVTVWNLVDENRLAYHAGLSSWNGFSKLNASSIGIEIVNKGFTDTPEGRVYYPFPQKQIDRVIALVKDIVARHQIRPEYILGHSDIAPQRKSDPGPMFPWKQLADAGLIPWPDATQVAEKMPLYEALLPDVSWFQEQLGKYGYTVPKTGILDDETRNVLIAFQTKYRPEKFDGEPDAQTAAMLDVLNNRVKTR